MSPQFVVSTAVNVLPAAVALSGIPWVLMAVGVAGGAWQPSTAAVEALALGLFDALGVFDALGAAAGVLSPPSLVARTTNATTTTRTAATTTATWRLRAASRSRWAAFASSFSWRRCALARSCSLVTRASVGRERGD